MITFTVSVAIYYEVWRFPFVSKLLMQKGFCSAVVTTNLIIYATTKSSIGEKMPRIFQLFELIPFVCLKLIVFFFFLQREKTL